MINFVKMGLLGFSIMALLLFSYVGLHFRQEIMNDNRVLVFFLLLLTFSIACIFCLRLSRDSQLTVLITLIAGSISIYAADIYFSFPVDPGLIRKTELKNKGVSNINMQTLAEHISYLRVQGEVTWPRPQGGWLLNQEKTTTLLWRSGEVLIPAGGISKSKTPRPSQSLL